MIRRQLASYSYVSPSCAVRASWDAALDGASCIDRLTGFLRDRFGAEAVVLTGSGTQALQLALALSGRAAGAPEPFAALPAYSCYDVATAAVGAGAQVDFYDLDPHTLVPDMDDLERVLAGGIGAVVVGNLFGFPVPWDLVRSTCEQKGVVLIEDCAQGLLSNPTGLGGGRGGDLTVLSFGRGKGWTGGGGGALLARGLGRVLVDEMLRDPPPPPGIGREVKQAVALFAQWILGRPSLYWIPSALPWLALGETTYHEPSPVSGMGARAAALAYRHAEPSFEELSRRRTVATQWDRIWDETLGSDRGLTRCRPFSGLEASYLRYPFLASGPDQAADLARAAGRWAAMRSYPEILPDLAEIAPIADVSGAFPGARRLAETLITLPTHRLVKPREQEDAIRAVVGSGVLARNAVSAA